VGGTFVGALEARDVEVRRDDFDVEAVGEVVLEDNTLVIRRTL
jgi:hypothetical protein